MAHDRPTLPTNTAFSKMIEADSSWASAAFNGYLRLRAAELARLRVEVVDSTRIVWPRTDEHPDATHFLLPDCRGAPGYALMRETFAVVCRPPAPPLPAPL